jgi:hypothetical protein
MQKDVEAGIPAGTPIPQEVLNQIGNRNFTYIETDSERKIIVDEYELYDGKCLDWTLKAGHALFWGAFILLWWLKLMEYT